VKTTVNVNEISQSGINGQSGPEMERALKEISDLKAKLKEYEAKMINLTFDNTEMLDESNTSSKRASLGKDETATVFLKEQLAFVNERLRGLT